VVLSHGKAVDEVLFTIGNTEKVREHQRVFFGTNVVILTL